MSHQDYSDFQDLKAERDRLKAELKTLSCPHCGSDVNGTNWKQKAEKLAEAIRDFKSEAESPVPDLLLRSGRRKAMYEALADFDEPEREGE